ncbi:peptide ABC transporter substrate-binding protein [Phototrophicus methaneseepsis]|uniref:Peptide ABC transporter substrate-binding protein n=1 Tax=Phototrophicus methaneseepsis TaxID=2710758 RepID=A0A7S8IDY2_9CHLR|nr:peptide ABC transporter substrate-binding protein [Phototrophicus methaneseepsis]QPC82021.1 peptide ABC transporter substrate-binding protein [Phototrophicus methaneseepsis]
MARYIRSLGVVAVIALLMTALGITSAQDMENVLRTDLGSSDVPTLDPALATDSSSIQIINETYIGLTMLDDETASTEPGIAESWDVTDNGDGTTTYTFNLMQEIPWVKYNAESGEVEQVMDADGNPRYVTAYDLEYGWERTLNPLTGGEYAYVLAPEVIGGADFNFQEVGEDNELTVTRDSVMFAAVDDYTFEVTTDAPKEAQLSIYGMWMARPQPSWVIEEAGELWIEPENFVSYGPFALWEWNHDEFISIVKNPFWPGTDNNPQAQLDGVVFNFLDSVTALAEYEAGNLDDLDEVDSASIPRIQSDPTLSEELVIEDGSCSYYYGMSVNVEPMTNVHLRRALSYAVDRQQIVDEVLQGGQTPASYFTLPSLNAAPQPEYMEEMGYGIGYDPDAAVEELEIAMEEMGVGSVDEIAPVTLLYNTSEGHRRIAEAIRDQWDETLGIEVQLTNQDFGVYLDQRPEFPIWRAGWCFDYPDTNNFLFDVFHSSSTNNDTGYVSEEFDSLVAQAATETDTETRMELYAQAEQLLVFEDAAIIPIYWYSDLELTKPYVDRTYAVDNSEQYENWSMSR